MRVQNIKEQKEHNIKELVVKEENTKEQNKKEQNIKEQNKKEQNIKEHNIKEHNKKERTYQDGIHAFGRSFDVLMILLLIAVPAVICIWFDIFPPLSNLLKGLGMVSMIYVPIAIAEYLTYVPMLGSNASYLVFVTGNLTNLKIPCAMMSMETAGVKPQTDEGEVVAGLSVATSSIVTLLILFIGMLLIVPLAPVLQNPALKPAFEHLMPALFGALGAYWVQKQWKLAIVPITLVVLIFLVVPVPSGVDGALIPVMGLISVLAARLMYKRGFLTSVDS
jgi:threonine/homoserine/homoserine lactone efflux protein